MAKTYAGSYLYRKYSEYEKNIFTFIMTATELDKDSADFDDIKYEVKKRQVSNALIKVLESKEVILMIDEKNVLNAQAFKVFCAKDIKGNNKDKMKVYIDCSNIIIKNKETGAYECKGDNINKFISYLVSATHTYIYYADERRITDNSKIIASGAQAFASLFTYVVDYLAKISSMPSVRNKCMYLSSLYYIGNILGKDYTSESSKKTARKISSLSEREAGILDIQLNQESMMNIKYFVDTISDILHLNKLSLDLIVEKWMQSFGVGTVFGLEIFPAFASIITDTYVGAYINRQNTIEKVVGQALTEFTKTLLTIGAESV